MAYNMGDEATFEVWFYNAAGALADPTTVTAIIQRPDLQTYTRVYGVAPLDVVKDAVGTYHINWTLDYGGLWNIRFQGTGLVQVAVQFRVYVDPSIIL